jgi:hypothetical protein
LSRVSYTACPYGDSLAKFMSAAENVVAGRSSPSVRVPPLDDPLAAAPLPAAAALDDVVELLLPPQAVRVRASATAAAAAAWDFRRNIFDPFGGAWRAIVWDNLFERCQTRRLRRSRRTFGW